MTIYESRKNACWEIPHIWYNFIYDWNIYS